MSTLQLHLPPQALANNDVQTLFGLPCAYTLYAKPQVVERAGVASIKELSAIIRNSKDVTFIVAAADVTLLRTAVPPLSNAKLRAALPNLIEEKLLVDVAECVVVCSPSGTMRTIAVTHRADLLAVILALGELGAEHIRALPEQLCLPYQQDRASAFVSEYQNGVSLAIRSSEHDGMGMVQSSPEAALQTLRALLPNQNIDLFVSSDALPRYQTLLANDEHIHVSDYTPAHWQIAALDMANGLGISMQTTWNWQPWKWPLALATLLIVINTLALNLGWWNMSREANNLRASIKQIYVSTFPKETVILDPLLQMQQKISAAQHDSGLGATDDFTNLAAEFGQAWMSVLPAANSVISGIEYHEHSLIVRLKSDVPATAMQTALAARNLSLDSSTNRTWQIRSKK